MSVYVLPDDRAREAGSRRSPNANILKDFVVTNRRLAAPPNTMGKTRPEVLTRRGTGVRGGFSSGGDGPSATRPHRHTQQGCLIPPPPLPVQMQPQAPWQLSSQQSPRSEPGSRQAEGAASPRPRPQQLRSPGSRAARSLASVTHHRHPQSARWVADEASPPPPHLTLTSPRSEPHPPHQDQGCGRWSGRPGGAGESRDPLRRPGTWPPVGTRGVAEDQRGPMSWGTPHERSGAPKLYTRMINT